MGLFSTKNIKTAVGNKSLINLSSRVVTTNDFGYCLPIFSRETVPGDKFKFNLSSFCRLDPMPVPSFTNIHIVHRAFYIPYKSVWAPWADFMAGRDWKNSSGATENYSTVPLISNLDIIEAFITYCSFDVFS